jgi:histidinol phosphatase-like enzyme
LNVIKINTDYLTIETLIALKETQRDKLKKELGEGELTEAEKANSILNKLSLLEVSLIAEKEKLDLEQQVYQKYILEKAAFDLSKKNIIGDKLTSETVEYYKEQIRYVDEDLESDLELAYNSRIEKIKLIFKKKFAVIEIYKEIKSKMDETIKENVDLLEEYPISIDASLVLNVRFINNFLSYINQAKLGTFKGSLEGENQLEKIISEIDFNSEEDLICFVNEIFDTFKFDKRSEGDPTARKYIVDQVSDVIGLYEYISSLDYLDYNYKLRQADKDLDQLSPGERGALLLVFYLLLDKNDCPLIIDQPEDNLDNHSVANILVPFIKRAKKRRQIIMVTHNPNLAVVADAEQVISVSLDKKNNNKFSFISGSIENKEINDSIVNILEGAMPAFTNRRKKYFQAR